MNRLRVTLEVGQTVLMPAGYGSITSVHRDGYGIADPMGQIREVPWTDFELVENLDPGRETAVHIALRPTWDMLDDESRQLALDRLEIVLEVVTGFREGHAVLARDGEPFHPYGPGFRASLHERCRRMAVELTRERDLDRRRQRRILTGELKNKSVSTSTIRLWLKAWNDKGLLGLVDGRKMRAVAGFELIDPDFRQAVREIVDTFDGDRSMISHKEVIRQVTVRLKHEGKTHVHAPERVTGEYVAWLIGARGRTTRAQRSTALRGASGTTHFPAIRPGQVVAIDATRSDVLVWDPLHERAFSVEILTAIDVATRVVLAVRVVPKSADGIDAGLLLYDVMRPFSQVVTGTEISHWRWAGVPETLDLTGTRVVTERGPLSPSGTLQGEHTIPGLLPEAIHCDHGSIFVGNHFRALLHDFGIDLLLSRGTRPVDNAHVERLHATYDAFYHQLPGYKSNNVAGRGRKVEQEPVHTAAELETLLRRWVALSYHQSWHEGLPQPDVALRRQGDRGARLTPLAMFDSLLDVTGRIDTPASPTLLYQFLPIRWGTIGHAGVEFENMVYDARCLDPFRNVRKGQFRAKDRAVPFFYDPHDVTRVWFRDADTDVVHEVPWRGAHLLDTPVTDLLLDSVRKRIRDRGGNLALNKQSTQRLILDELTELSRTPSTAEWRAKVSAAARRVEASVRDHAEAQEAQADALARAGTVTRLPARPGASVEVSAYVDEWPDLEADL